MTESGTHPSSRLYQIVGVHRDGTRTVIMSGMQFDEANAAREATKRDPQYVWVLVEREPESG